MHDSGKASQAKVCARVYHVMLTSRRWQMDPNDPNYDPDEDEPRRAPVDLHAGKDADVAAYKQAVRAPGACSKPDMLACSNGVVKCSRAFHAGRAGRCHPGGVLQQRRCWRDRHGSAGVAIMHCVAADAQFGNAVYASPHFNGMPADACEPVLCLCEGPAVFAGHLLVQGLLAATPWRVGGRERAKRARRSWGSRSCTACLSSAWWRARWTATRASARWPAACCPRCTARRAAGALAACLWKAAHAQDGVGTLCSY